MDPFLARVRSLLNSRATGALGTLHEDVPFVSLVPFALVPGAALIHISGLAAHTKDLQSDPRASLLVSAPEEGAEDLRALPRVTLQVEARLLEPGSPAHLEGRQAYLARFPSSEGIFDLGDFHLVALEFMSARAVLGFGQARTLTVAELREILAD
jgi:putative heme iron utilization protein